MSQSVTQSISQINGVMKWNIKEGSLKAANYYCPLVKFSGLWKNLWFTLSQFLFHKSSLAFPYPTWLNLSNRTFHKRISKPSTLSFWGPFRNPCPACGYTLQDDFFQMLPKDPKIFIRPLNLKNAYYWNGSSYKTFFFANEEFFHF